MERSRIKAFREAMASWADDRLTPDDLRPRLRVDGRLGFRDITPALMTGLTRLAPFGIGNPRPVFWTPGTHLADGPRRLKERHLSMSLRHDGVALRGVFWRAAERAPAIEAARASGLDVAYSVEQNTFKGTSYLELTLADVRAAEPSVP
jgi:single-stranded-DNA-specific exonuclease